MAVHRCWRFDIDQPASGTGFLRASLSGRTGLVLKRIVPFRIDPAGLHELPDLRDLFLRQTMICVRKIGAMAVKRHMQLAGMGGIHLRAQFSENALDILQ